MDSELEKLELEMFEWKKDTHGCNCCPVPKGGEKYTLCIGRLFVGTVKSLHDKYKDPEKIAAWESEVSFLGHVITGHGGGKMSRNEHMFWVETTIRECIKEISNTMFYKPGRRRIKDILCQTNPETGKLEQKLLEIVDDTRTN